MESAKQYLRAGNHERAIQTASTSVENIARALIHCCGGKPDPGSGQEEALRLLTRRFQGAERIEFEEAIDNAVRIGHNRIVQKYTSIHKVQTKLFGEATIKRILESASKTATLFRQIITKHFGEELPELQKTYQKCH